MRSRRVAGAVASLVFFGACETGTRPSTPEPSTPRPVSPEKIIPIGFGGPFALPGKTIRLREGMLVEILVETDGQSRDFTNGGEFEGIPVKVTTDAPPSQVTAGGTVRVEGSRSPGRARIRVLTDEFAEPDATYSMWLEEPPDLRLGGGFVLGLDPTRLRFTVTDAEPQPDCSPVGISAPDPAAGPKAAGEHVGAVFATSPEHYFAGDFVLRTGHPAPVISLLAPYGQLPQNPDEAAPLLYAPFPMAFAGGLRLRETGDGLEQTLSLRWLADLELRVEAAGCEPVTVSCDGGRCGIR